MTRFLLFFILILCITLIGYLYDQTNSIDIVKHNFQLPSNLQDFHNFKILLISDLHSKKFGKDHHKLFEQIKGLHFDLIAVTGDLLGDRIYSYKNNPKNAITLMEELRKLEKVYYVSGNHEACINYPGFKKQLRSMGIQVLSNTGIPLWKNKRCLFLCGIENEGVDVSDLSKAISRSPKDCFRILLCHEPRILPEAADKKIPLVLCGHTHGGQICLPVVKDCKFFKENYKRFGAGWYSQGETKMYITRGLGTSGLPFRFHCKPEITLITFRTDRREDV